LHGETMIFFYHVIQHRFSAIIWSALHRCSSALCFSTQYSMVNSLHEIGLTRVWDSHIPSTNLGKPLSLILLAMILYCSLQLYSSSQKFYPIPVLSYHSFCPTQRTTIGLLQHTTNQHNGLQGGQPIPYDLDIHLIILSLYLQSSADRITKFSPSAHS
jgi:hypothetical protein